MSLFHICCEPKDSTPASGDLARVLLFICQLLRHPGAVAECISTVDKVQQQCKKSDEQRKNTNSSVQDAKLPLVQNSPPFVISPAWHSSCCAQPFLSAIGLPFLCCFLEHIKGFSACAFAHHGLWCQNGSGLSLGDVTKPESPLLHIDCKNVRVQCRERLRESFGVDVTNSLGQSRPIHDKTPPAGNVLR